ncbi:MAG: hypothetical protein ACHQ50_09635, partial [Fimbriimonadales bacterium]
MKRPILFFCALLFCAVAFPQTVTKIELAKDNGKGKPGQVVKGFSPTDSPLHCVIRLKPLSSTVIFTGTLIAVNAAKVKNFKIAATDLSATPGMDIVDFKFSLPRAWPVGNYKIELKANNKALRDVA